MTRMLWGAVGVLLLVTPVHAAESVRTVRDVTAIVDGSGVGRLLFKVDLPAELGPVAVKQAIVTVPLRALEGYPEGGALDLRLHPVARSWEPGAVSWTAGWRRPGGDFDDELYGHADVSIGSAGTVQFDVTMILKEVLEHGMEFHGFLLAPAPGTELGLDATARGAFADLGNATLEIRYRATPRRHGGEKR